MSEVAEQPVGQASATNDADNISFEGLGEMLQEKRVKAQQEEPAEVTQEQTDAGATEEPETEPTPEVESPEGPEDQPAEEEDNEAEAQDADDAEESAGLDERTQESVNKRIGKLTAQRKRAEESRQDAEERLGETQAENRKLQEQLDKSRNRTTHGCRSVGGCDEPSGNLKRGPSNAEIGGAGPRAIQRGASFRFLAEIAQEYDSAASREYLEILRRYVGGTHPRTGEVAGKQFTNGFVGWPAFSRLGQILQF